MKAVDAVCLDFSKALDSVSCNIPIEKLYGYPTKYGSQKWTVKVTALADPPLSKGGLD